MPSPTIRIWRCPVCREMAAYDFTNVSGHGHWMRDDEPCDGVPVEYIACPSSEAVVYDIEDPWPGDALAAGLMIPAPENT